MQSGSFRIAAFAALLPLLFVSCSFVEDRTSVAPAQDEESATWTVLFYGAGSTSLDVQEDGSSSVLETVENFQRTFAVNSVQVVAAVSSEATQNSMRVYSINESAAEAETTPYVDLGPRDMSSGATLEEFIRYGTETYPAEHIALVLMGDGHGWRGVLRDDQHGASLMSLSSVHNAVHASVGRADLIAWLVPGMSSVETAYECYDIADFMVGCAWPLAHDVTQSPRVWLMDLMQNPEMSAERLGMMMVDGLYESALGENDSVQYSLLRLANISSLVPEVDSLAMALRPYTEDRELELPALWSAAWVSSTDDSQSVDVGRLTAEVLDVPALATDPLVEAAASHVFNGLEDLIIYSRTTLPGETRHGVSIYLPYQPDSATLEEYSGLSLSQDHPGWRLLLEAYSETAPTLSGVSGDVRWAGHVLENLYFFANVNQVGAPNIALTSPAQITATVTEDFVSYASSFALDQDTLSCYVGVFQDLDFSGTLTTNDRYGYYHLNAQPPRDWITLRSGESLGDIHVVLDRTF